MTDDHTESLRRERKDKDPGPPDPRRATARPPGNRSPRGQGLRGGSAAGVWWEAESGKGACFRVLEETGGERAK